MGFFWPFILNPNVWLTFLLDLKAVQFLPVASLQAELLTGYSVNNVEDAHHAAQELLRRGCTAVIITLGPRGCVVLKAQDKTSTHVPSTAVKAVDTTVRKRHIVIWLVMWMDLYQYTIRFFFCFFKVIMWWVLYSFVIFKETIHQ